MVRSLVAATREARLAAWAMVSVGQASGAVRRAHAATRPAAWAQDRLGAQGRVFSAAAAARFVKFYDQAAAPTVGTDTPLFTLGLPAGAAANVEFVHWIAFANGIGLGATTGAADANTGAPAANDLSVAVFYK